MVNFSKLTVNCELCNTVIDVRGDLAVNEMCVTCNGRMRPRSVWFGEVPLRREETRLGRANEHVDRWVTELLASVPDK